MRMQQDLTVRDRFGEGGCCDETPEPGRRGARSSRADAAQRLELSQLRRLEFASLIEGSTLVILVFVAVPLRHLAGWRGATAAMGRVHGLAFLIYLWTWRNRAAGLGA